jgi:hypothetical protein
MAERLSAILASQKPQNCWGWSRDQRSGPLFGPSFGGRECRIKGAIAPLIARRIKLVTTSLIACHDQSVN